MTKVKGPRQLKNETREWWVSIVQSYELESHHLRLLTLAGEAWDRAQQARRILDARGLTYDDRYGQPRVRPEIGVERDNRIVFARMLRELGLDVVEPGPIGRPPGGGGTRCRG